MRESIHVWRYALKSRAALNAVSGRTEYEGALIRIGDGFGCLHPWPELGDPGLEDLLVELRNDAAVSGLAKEAVSMSALDARWRHRGESMLDEAEQDIPESHATLPECTVETVTEAVGRGFSVMKVKGRRDFPELAGRIDELSRHWPHLMWRIDFNEVLTRDETLEFARGMTDHARKRIDFLEDPCPWKEEDWEEIRRVARLQLALDRRVCWPAPGADVLVLKPARGDVATSPWESKRLVFTSNMDHPLGQCFAAWRAGQLVSSGSTVDICG
ncbi:MAG: enolase C-terminal domain-like protein, partial [Verrucomicrobiota bacterium]|nr:enolase C-terminal domain-like protein [Verrucomicrobiota bacterium]